MLIRLLNRIEGGAPWPKVMLQTKAAFLAKDNGAKGDCMKFRILTLMPILYRRWARAETGQPRPLGKKLGSRRNPRRGFLEWSGGCVVAHSLRT